MAGISLLDLADWLKLQIKLIKSLKSIWTNLMKRDDNGWISCWLWCFRISKDNLRQEALSIGGHLYSDWDTGGVLALIARQPKVEAKAIEYAQWVYDTDVLIGDWVLGYVVLAIWRMIIFLQCNLILTPLWFAGSKFCPNCGKTMIKAKGDNKIKD